MAKKRSRRAPKHHPVGEILKATRDAYYEAAKELGYPLTRAQLQKSVYIDKKSNWTEPPAVLVNYEVGAIPYWGYYDFGMQIMEEANELVRKKLGPGYYIEGGNPALDFVETPAGTRFLSVY